MYNKGIKRGIDLILSLVGLIILSPVFIILCIWIKLDSKGPILFKQKRVGINKSYFNILKFRTMYIDTPKDMPTHMLKDPEQFITKSGKFLRKTSLDELPQIINILKGEMSIIGPRPALWNQDDLIAERDKYHANDVKPGLTGWAQINGRDELEIPVKAKLDGEYVEKESLLMDIKCFLGTIGSVLVGDGVVEGGTGEMEKASQSKSPEKLSKEIMIGAGVVAGAGTAALGILGTVVHKMKKKNKLKKESKCIFKRLFFIALIIETVATVVVNIKRKKKLNDNVIHEENNEDNADEDISERKILITGSNSYIGVSVENWLKDKSDKYHIDTLDMMDESWRNHDFSKYDVVYHVAGIAHADVGNVSDEIKNKYYAVNTELAIEVCKKAKENNVKQFIFMSSMIVYSGCKETFITKETKPKAENFYGDSKLQADLAIQKLGDDEFKVCVIRPPMIYGKGSKGNYPMLAKLAIKLPVFPIVKNRRSMIHIDNLCEFVRLMIDNEENGVFFPQNDEYTNTSDMVEMIAKVKGHRIIIVPGFNLIIKCISELSGKIGTIANKAFGDSAYDMKMSEYKKNYRVHSLSMSIIVTESEKPIDVERINSNGKQKILLIALPGYSKGIKDKMVDLGYDVIHINDKPNDGVICKTLGRLKIPFYVKKIDQYYKNILKDYKGVKFDYIVAIRGEYTPIDSLKYMAEVFPSAKRILYMWDSLLNNKGIEQKWDYYDEVFTFDRIDYINNKDTIKFLPLYYYEDYLPHKNKGYKYDIAFIGTGHGDRVKIVKQVEKQCRELGLKCYIYIFLPHRLIYLKNKLFNADYKNVKINDIHFEMLPLKKSYEIYDQAMCVMDIESSTQNGLTMRTIEMIGLKKKLITTNRDIKNYDFYNKNNVMVSNRNNFIIDTEFFKNEYELLDENIYKKYSLSNWIKVLLGDDKE